MCVSRAWRIGHVLARRDFDRQSAELCWRERMVFRNFVRRFYPNTDISERLGKPWLFGRGDRSDLKPSGVASKRSVPIGLFSCTSAFRASHQETVTFRCVPPVRLTAPSVYGYARARCTVPYCSIVHWRGGFPDNSFPTTSIAIWVRLIVCAQAWRRLVYSVPRMACGSRVDTMTRGERLYTLRPARFAFSRLDHGIEQRSAFGPPHGK